jgi:DNA-directed RNA polymerase specialized sigma24 family protein
MGGGQVSVLKNLETIGRPRSLSIYERSIPPGLEMPMLRWKKNQHARENAAAYATRSDFQEIFTEDMAGLHLLAFLLTADQEKAEQCFVAGLEESIRGNAVFRQWARSWSKRAIIKNAIKAISPAPGRPGLGDTRNGAAWSGGTGSGGTLNEDAPGSALISAVTRLEPFGRFVLVMAVLEGYSVGECSALLGRPAQEVAAAKSQALARLGPLASSAADAPGNGTVSWASFLEVTPGDANRAVPSRLPTIRPHGPG